MAPMAMSDLFPSVNSGGTPIKRAATIQRMPVTLFGRFLLFGFVSIFFSLWD